MLEEALNISNQIRFKYEYRIKILIMVLKDKAAFISCLSNKNLAWEKRRKYMSKYP